MRLNDNWEFTLAKESHKWQSVDLPHDWSVDKTVFPVIFSKEGTGGGATGHVNGGTGYYKKNLVFGQADRNKDIYLYFEGIYMEAEVYVNNTLVAHNTNGYTSFYADISAYCTFDGTNNVLEVKVKNEGKNSRWYSGSGIYRNVWLVEQEKIHLKPWGIGITTAEVNGTEAKINIALYIQNGLNKNKRGNVKIEIVDSADKTVVTTDYNIIFLTAGTSVSQGITVPSPNLWDINSPYLYTAKIALTVNGKTVDQQEQPFGIRTITFDADKGFQLNGRTIKLKGGCIHHDNGLLGAKAIDRAEERKIELLLSNGFNAIRLTHNPPSQKLLKTCDKLGMLVIDEAFDQWTQGKNPDDYHRFFDQYAERDLSSMILRDRNHPSIIMWSIGNEIPERSREKGVEIAKKLKDIVHRYDTTRPVTAAVNEYWDNPDQTWKDSEAAFSNLDVAGYNYMWWEYENDHKLFPQRVMFGSESAPKEANINWDLVEKHPYLIGDFVWTAMDYMGESGIGHAYYIPKDSTDKKQFMYWSWFNGFCGDLDICGNKKPQSYYHDVLWERSPVSVFTSQPIPSGMKEKVSYWGWKQEAKTWDYPQCTGQPIPVTIYTKGDSVELYLNNRLTGTKGCGQQTAYTASFDIPYQAGELKAIAYKNGKIIGYETVSTPTDYRQIVLNADRTIINASKNDLSFVNIEIRDNNGTLVNTNDLKLTLGCKGAGRIIASGNASPNDMASFNSLTPLTYRGQAQAIIQPDGKKGLVELTVAGEGLQTKSILIECR